MPEVDEHTELEVSRWKSCSDWGMARATAARLDLPGHLTPDSASSDALSPRSTLERCPKTKRLWGWGAWESRKADQSPRKPMTTRSPSASGRRHSNARCRLHAASVIGVAANCNLVLEVARDACARGLEVTRTVTVDTPRISVEGVGSG